jgi:hypothetical protein
LDHFERYVGRQLHIELPDHLECLDAAASPGGFRLVARDVHELISIEPFLVGAVQIHPGRHDNLIPFAGLSPLDPGSPERVGEFVIRFLSRKLAWRFWEVPRVVVFADVDWW